VKTRHKQTEAEASTVDGLPEPPGGLVAAPRPGWPAPPSGQIGWFAAAIRSDRGQERDDNQDSVVGMTGLLPRISADSVPVPFGFFAVADGMGGLADGANASIGAIRTVTEHVVKTFLLPALDMTQRNAGQGTVTEILRDAVQAANAALYQQMRRSGVASGTTFSAALLLGRQLTTAHAGDSRIYLDGPEGLRRLTTDHSMVGRLIEMGQMQPEDVYNNPQRNALYRTLGQAAQLEVETASYALGHARHLLLCSDGLWDVVGENALSAALAEAPTIEDAADRLVAEANALGGPDNISVIIVRLT
jgi:serine/threonine protein phosphatase PrpC